MGQIFIDIGPLRRFPHFRRLWSGYAIRQFGSQVAVATVIYQVFVITRSNIDVGLLSLVQLGPSVVAPLIGGAIADAIDRRLLLVATAILLALCSVGLAINATGGHPALWPLYVCSAATLAFSGIDAPTRQAVMMNLVDRDAFVGANVLRQLLGQFASIAGPGVAGLLIYLFHSNFAAVYWVDVASTIAALQAVLRLPPLLPAEGGRRFSAGSIIEGLRYLKGRQEIQACFIADLNATVLGQPTSLYPYMALVHFHGGARAFGLLSAAPGIGALIGSLLSGWTAHVHRQGLAVLLAIVVWGAAIVVFGFSPWLWLGVILLGIAGWGNAVSALFRNTIIQLEVPDRMRGRLSSIQAAVTQSGPRLGNGEAGLVAGLVNTPFSIVSGGLGCIIGIALVAKFMPKFATYDMRNASFGEPESTVAV